MLHDKYLTEMFQSEFVSTSAVTHVLSGKDDDNDDDDDDNNNNNNKVKLSRDRPRWP